VSLEILLSTYDGARHLDAQVDSLLAQTDGDWTLTARDDGSADETPRLLEARARAGGGRVRVLEDGGTRLGPGASFATLLAASTASHVMFCDQDDVWLPDKVARSRALMREMEARFGAERPLLVHSDLRVTDGALNPVAASFWRSQGLDPTSDGRLDRLLLRNAVTGCTMMLNAALRRLALPIAADAYLHDWWIALVAAAFGHTARLEEPTVLYRRHGANVVGARSASRRLGEVLREPGRVRRYYRRARAQAAAFQHAYGGRLPEPARSDVARFIDRWSGGPWARALAVARGPIRERGLARNVAFVCCG
jgi:glycosyltransferase involved in cell wall biosynthesis